ncbi:hypothetical protein BCR43DRAFT_197198 [Syncephalastrum racemosum]|uniref:F-box domain-containing protein n=1 Tax=Syncephalastrum racemosum TaxID=13706 RepID=A0A1X2HHJ2_SYNRA|nr:hypothetical protein BCR43DRAFT_197198 [Syncephalastrum racemosum]
MIPFSRANREVEMSHGRNSIVFLTCTAHLDILEKLPYDVASVIFDYLDFPTRVSCTGVCRAWRLFLLQEKDIMWRDISLALTAKTYSDICKHWLSRVNGESVRSVKIQIKSGRCDTVLDRLIKAQCDKVISLTIHGKILLPSSSLPNT